MRIVIVGAGAIGGVTAARLAQGGQDVTLVVKTQALAERIQTRGLHLTGVWGTADVPLPTTAGVESLTGRFDCALIVTKAYDLEAAARSLLPFLKPDSLVVSVQNGVCTDLLAKIVGPSRTAAAVVTWSSTLVSEGALEVTASGGFLLGRADGRIDPQLLALQAALNAVAPTQVTDSILSGQLSKLIINSGITCGGAIAGQTLGRMLLRPVVRRFFICVVREDLAVAKVMGVTVPKFGGRLDYYRFAAGDGLFASLRRHITLFAVGLKYWNLTSSSLTSLRRGRPTEAPWLNGYIARQGKALGVPTPVNDAVMEMAAQLEAGTRKSSPRNFRELPGLSKKAHGLL